jgi:hypothetical protein
MQEIGNDKHILPGLDTARDMTYSKFWVEDLGGRTPPLPEEFLCDPYLTSIAPESVGQSVDQQG